MASRLALPEASCSSSESLDLKEIVSRTQTDNLLNASITFLSLTDSTRSLQSAPSFPSLPARPVLVTLSSGNILLDRPAQPTSSLTIPTIPRLKRVIKEPITVARWAEGVSTSPSSDHQPWSDVAQDDSTPRTRWTPSGSLFAPEAFRTILRKCRLPRSESWTLVIQTAIQDESIFFDRSDANIMASCIDYTERDDIVPTIMLSNSTAAMPLPLESHQSISRLASAPPALAARRGRAGPPTLPLPSLPLPVTDLYPGIPTPFRGSPGAYTPTFEFADSSGDFSMDLEAMCQDLRSRCPPLTPPTPILAVNTDPLLEVSPGFGSSNKSDSDEWDFARELLEVHIERPHVSSAGNTPMRPTSMRLPESPVPDVGTPNSSSDVSWGTEPTLTNSPPSAACHQIESILEEDEDEDAKWSKSVPVSDLPKQQRRRTVIIETPRNSVTGAPRPVRMTVDLSHLADEKEDTVTPEPVTTEIPFERQSQAFVSTRSSVAPSVDAGNVRPISSASMGRPVRSILKTREKKSVRFSEMPSTREFTVEERQLESVFEADELDQDTAENTVSNTGGRKRAETTPSYKPRHSSSVATSKAASGDDQLKRTSFPKHPAIRSLGRSSAPPKPAPSAPASKGSKPGHQSMLVDRTKVDIGRPKRLTGVPPARSSLPAIADKRDSTKGLRKKQSKDENSWRRSGSSPPSEKGQSSPTSVQKSRMPFKSILTKFRS
ncbi:hypothetical protein BC629DRAFT_1586580 [Irpex lacteus]|nr:hypothetical protein BC629DRAFT_1586580 [Irpex lacteus]